jgi:hypothetical protein
VIRRLLFWPLAFLLGVFGLACVAYPVAMLLAFDPGAHLLDDTRAARGAGRDAGFRITRAACTWQEFGHDGGTASETPHSIEYDCEFDLDAPSHDVPAVEPDWPNMSYEQRDAWQRAEQEKYSARLRELERGPGPDDPPATLRRRLPDSVAGRPLPAVRLMTPDGVPPRFALVWPDGGLGLRWFHWGWETALFLGFAFGCFFAISALRRKLR